MDVRRLAGLVFGVTAFWAATAATAQDEATAASNRRLVNEAAGHVDVQVECPAQTTIPYGADRMAATSGRQVTMSLSKPGNGYKVIRPLLLAGATVAAMYRCPMSWLDAEGVAHDEGFIGSLVFYAAGQQVLSARRYSPDTNQWEEIQEFNYLEPAAEPVPSEEARQAANSAKPRHAPQAPAVLPVEAAPSAKPKGGHGAYAMSLIFAGMAMVFGGVFLTPFGSGGFRVTVGIVAGFLLCAGGQVLLRGGDLLSGTPLLSSLVLGALVTGWVLRLLGARPVQGEAAGSPGPDYGYVSRGSEWTPGHASASSDSAGSSASGSRTSEARPINMGREHKFTERDGYSVRASDTSRMNHYSRDRKPAGHSKVTSNWLTGFTTKHFNAGKQNTGYSRTSKGVFGGVTTTHYNKRGEKTGYSRPTTDFFGNPKTSHYDKSGRKTGESKSRPTRGGKSGSRSSHSKRRR